MKNVFKKQNGIGLLELMLALAIITVLLMMAVRYFAVTSSSQKISSLVEEMKYIEGGLLKYATITNKGYDADGLTPKFLVDSDYVSSDIVDTSIDSKGAFKSGITDSINTSKGLIYFIQPTPTAAKTNTYVIQAVYGDKTAVTGDMCKKLGRILVGEEGKGGTTATGCTDDATKFYYVFSK
jgi:type II secretory pathway pseudopilin PulG